MEDNAYAQQRLRERIKVCELDKEPMSCNDNIPELADIHRQAIRTNVELAFQGVLDALCIDTEHDHNTRDTAKRIAKMYVDEIFRGRFYPMPDVTAFPNAKKYDQIYTVGPITVRSTCAHHFQNITGKCWIGVKPGEKVIGLSKFNRLVDWVASRPTIQEEMTEQIADIIEELTEAKGIAVVVRAEHHCMTHRGVKEHESDMVTSVMRGEFRDEPSLKAEFLSLIDMKG